MKIQHTKQRQLQHFEARRGAAMLECAITLPVLMMLVLGVLEIGAGLRASTILQSACREAGRLAAMDWRYVVDSDDTPNEKVERDLKNFMTASGLQGSAATVSIVHADGVDEGEVFDLSDEDNELQLVRIQVTLPYSSVSVFPLTYLGGKSLKAFIVFRATMTGGSLSD